jgi:hypothetical protein
LEPTLSTLDLDAAQASLREAEARFKRAQNLYLVGEIDRDQYDAEKERQAILKKSLTFFPSGDSLAFSDSVAQQLQHWAQQSSIEQKRLTRMALESVFLRGDAVVGYQPTPACSPLCGNASVVTTDPTGVPRGGITRSPSS